MGKKLEGNGLWESSRMILPEHKESILQHRRELNRKQKPILDEQRIEEFVRTISTGMFTERPVRIKLFGEFEDREIVGVIEKVETATKQIKIDFGDDDFEWIKLKDVLEMEIE